MGDKFGSNSDTNLPFIEFDDQQIANIGAALQAVAEHIERPKVDQQLFSNYKVDEGSDTDVGISYVKTIKQENPKIKDETLVIDNTLSIKSEDGLETCISNQPDSNQALFETSNDLSTYISIKEEPLLLKSVIEPPAHDEKSLTSYKDNLYFSKEIESIKMEDIANEGAGLSKDCDDEGGDAIDSLELEFIKTEEDIADERTELKQDCDDEMGDELDGESIHIIDSQDEDDDQNVEQEATNINYNSFIRYICPECGVECGPHSKWKLHTETQHTIAWHSFMSEGESCYQCLKCKQKLSKTSSSRILQEHHIKHLPHFHLKCNFCDTKFQALTSVYNHIKLKHAEIIAPYLKNKRLNSNMRHVKIFCPICQQSQSDIKQLWKHLTEKHDYEKKIKSQVTQLNKNLYLCKLCHKKTRGDYLKMHMLTHEPNQSFQCNFCKTYTTHLNATLIHIKFSHLGNQQSSLLDCSYCGATFARKFLLLRHHHRYHKNEISKHESTVPWLNNPIKTYSKK